MGITIALLSFMALLFGMTLLILVCGMQSREEERALAASALSAAGQTLPEPDAFRVHMAPILSGPTPDPAFLRQLELHLVAEREAADGFVLEPSSELLYHHRPEAEPQSETSVASQVEGFLRRELATVASYVTEPSVERLYGHCEPLALAV